MNMRKRKNTRESAVFLTPLAARVLHIGLVPIYASLLRLLYEIRAAAPFTAGVAAYYGRLLEYPLAALALLSGAVLLFNRAEREV